MTTDKTGAEATVTATDGGGTASPSTARPLVWPRSLTGASSGFSITPRSANVFADAGSPRF